MSVTSATLPGGIPIDSIKVGKRTRVRMGDMPTLMASIKARGLLHPPAIAVDGTLVAGLRRLEACKALGWKTIPVTLVASITDELSALLAEGEENECREGFTPSEAVEHKRRIEGVIAAAAAERTGGRPDKTSVNLTEVPKAPRTERETRTRVAKAVGIGATTLAKAETVLEAAEAHPDPVVRDVARRAVEEMDDTGKVDPAYRKVEKAREEAVIAFGDRLVPDEERRRTKLRANAAKCIHEFTVGVLALDAADVAQVLDPEQWLGWEIAQRRATEWFAALMSARPTSGLRLVSGGEQ